jgi:DNA-binding NarL/FixJ family response regulator
MLSATASSVLLLAGIGLAVYLLLLRRAAADHAESREMKRMLDEKLVTLHELIVTARREAERLESAIKNAQTFELESLCDTLGSLEGLADPSSLADPDALRRAASQLPQLPSDVAGDVFDSDQTTLAIARLKDQGNSAEEIARRLGLSLGEIELRLSLRAA